MFFKIAPADNNIVNVSKKLICAIFFLISLSCFGQKIKTNKFFFHTYQGKKIILNKINAPLLLFVWSSNHSHCIKRLAIPFSIHLKFCKKGLITCAVGLGNRSIEKALLNQKGFKFSYTGFIAPNMLSFFNFHSIPFYVLFSKKGNIIYTGYKSPPENIIKSSLINIY